MEIRPVSEHELLAASRLNFPALPARDADARAAIARAPHELGVDFRRQIVAVSAGHVCGACLYVLTAGRSAIVLRPVVVGDSDAPAMQLILVEMVAQARRVAEQAGAALIETLLDEAPDEPMAGVFAAAGFTFLALLEYLELDVAASQFPAADNSWDYETYRPELEADFAALIRESYDRSLDCPALDRVRTLRDALAGHKTSGIFTPQNWVLARRGGAAAGLVLVNGIVGRAACELVYMGVAPAFRGLGLGQWLVQKAIDQTRAAGQPVLTLAVDVKNEPARRIYAAAGFRTVGQRYAYFVPPQE